MTVFACDVTDDAGVTIHLKKPAQRIISLAPDMTETLFAIGAGANIIGVMSHSDYPKAARDIPVMGSYSGIDLERIVSLHPDLIVTWGHQFSRQLNALKQLGIPIYTIQATRLEDIPKTMMKLGCLTRTEKTAEQAANAFSQRLSALHLKYSSQKPVSVFYQIGSYSLITINKKSWINQVITLCGGRNLFANAKSIAPEVSWESVVSANPDVILTDATNADWKKRWERWTSISAVKHHDLFSLPPDLIDRAGPRLIDGAEQLCESLLHARDHLII